MVIQVAFFVLGLLPLTLSEQPTERCGDGSAPWQDDGSPNWRCIRDDCNASANLCWEDALDHCFDSEGIDLGVCTYSVSTCDSKVSCFDLWWNCKGEYECLDTESTLGCEDGTCTTGTIPEFPESTTTERVAR